MFAPGLGRVLSVPGSAGVVIFGFFLNDMDALLPLSASAGFPGKVLAVKMNLPIGRAEINVTVLGMHGDHGTVVLIRLLDERNLQAGGGGDDDRLLALFVDKLNAVPALRNNALHIIVSQFTAPEFRPWRRMPAVP